MGVGGIIPLIIPAVINKNICNYSYILYQLGGWMLVYFYDLKPRKKGDYNRMKRVFYYNFNKIKLEDFSFKTKSVFMVAERYEKLIDSFFSGFKGDIEVYKIRTDGVEQLF